MSRIVPGKQQVGLALLENEYPVTDINFPELRLRRYSEWPGLREKLWGWHIGRHQ